MSTHANQLRVAAATLQRRVRREWAGSRYQAATYALRGRPVAYRLTVDPSVTGGLFVASACPVLVAHCFFAAASSDVPTGEADQ